MAKPYSMDLRERVVAAVEREGLSRHAAAARFGVAPSSAIKWVQRHRATGSAAFSQMGGHKPRVLRGEHRDWLLERVGRDFTLRGLVAELAERGVKVDYRQVWEFVHAEGLSFKNVWPARDYQDFRVWAGIMGTRSSPYVTTQRTDDTERVARPAAGGRRGQRCL